MTEPDTDTLRKMAPCWTLASDERLLSILQTTHQKLMVRCKNTNTQLEQMATALDEASISLQNVNNQFMALSSSQFIERRVYDDDVDVVTETPAVKETPKLSAPDDISMLRRGIAVLESTHDVITILHDSDTDSDTDDDATSRLVMKPKDMYADRPLPYIIGSEPWKSKWHAGLMPEDSDSDSSTSKVDRESDQYSQSEPEDYDVVNRSLAQDAPSAMEYGRKMSETSSEVASEPTPSSKPTPSDVAGELARRLGGADPRVVNREPQYDEPAKAAVRTVYKPQEPVASTIFPDEPPPLEYQTDSDTDIFADLHRKQPYNQPYSRQEVADELFGDRDSDNGGDIFSDFADQPSASKPVSIFEAGPTPHMFDRRRQVEQHPPRNERPDGTVEQPPTNTADTDSINGVKKPVGGISLFGSNSGTENIGAAILKRNRRKSSSSDRSENENHKSPVKDQQAKKEKNIFDDLFAKSETKNVISKDKVTKDIKEDRKQKQETVIKDSPKPIDLFSDNLFDDIDDIFTTNVVKPSKDKQKSIFEDDDDLFSGIAETKPAKDIPKKEGLFDSDDDLFSENIPKQKPLISNKPQSTARTEAGDTEASENSKENMDLDRKNDEKPTTTTIHRAAKPPVSIFNDEEDDIFSNNKNKNKATEVENIAAGAAVKTVNIKKKLFNSPSLFDDDEDESDLFTDSNKLNDNKHKARIDNKVSVETKTIPHTKSDDLSGNDGHEVSADTTCTTITDIKKDISDKPIPPIRNKIIKAVPRKPETIQAEIPPSLATNILRKQLDTDQNLLTKLSNNHDATVEDVDDTRKSSDPKLVQDNKSDSYEITSTNVIETASVNTKNKDLITKTVTDDKNTPLSYNSGRTPETNPVEVSSNNKNVISNNDFGMNTANIVEAPKNTQNTNEDMIEEPSKIDHISPKSDIFTDIVSEPPDFEKPKEPKKSKNVNALFDDDSDDETLFFKREDAITDEKPEDFTVKQDRLFNIFTTEPPDEDFTQMATNSDEDLFSTLPKPKLPNKQITANFIDTNALLTNIDTSTINEIIADESYVKPEYPKLDLAKIKENESNIYVTETKIEKLSREFDSFSGETESIVTKPESLKSTVAEKLLSDDEDLFKSLPVELDDSKTELKSKISDTIFKSDEEIFKSLPPNLNKVEIPKPMLSRSENIILPTEPELLDSIPKLDNVEVKKISKLKVGLNINVNALLPGASPKKVKAVDNNESQIEINKELNVNALTPRSLPNKVNDNNDSQNRIEIQNEINVNSFLPRASPKKVKPVDIIDGQAESQVEKYTSQVTKHISFDGEPESKVLDSKLSKERPRIQVKRRPSSRKARKEAVRKSGIDFGEDSTDNSSSIVDPPIIQADIVEVTDNLSRNSIDTTSNEITSSNNKEYSEETVEIKTGNLESEHFSLRDDSLITDIQTEAKTESLANQTHTSQSSNTKKSDSTTKIVYILNDEDIFDTNITENTNTLTSISKENMFKSLVKPNISDENTSKSTEITNIISGNTDNVHPHKITDTYNINAEPIIKTLGNTYKSNKTGDSTKSKSLFGEDDQLDDEEIFKSKTPKTKSAIFDDSDSEGDLFSKTIKDVNKVVNAVKGSLFGDDDDGDDLFGVKTSKRVAAPQQPTKATSSVKEPSKSTQAVFEDPLSLFGDDD